MKHAIERAAVLARASQIQGDVTLHRALFNFSEAGNPEVMAAPENEAPEVTSFNLQQATQDFQRQQITKILQAHQMNWSAAARALEMDGGNLHRLAKRLGMKA